MLLEPTNIVGVEGALFGESIQSRDLLDNNVWPRLLAIAERGWNEGEWEKYNGSNPLGNKLLQRDFDL